MVSFLALALALVSLTHNSLALWTILSLQYKKFKVKICSVGQNHLDFEISWKNDTLLYLPLVDGDTLGDSSAISSVVHEKHFNILFVTNEEILETVWKQMSGLVILLVSNEHLFWLSTSKSSSCWAINTSNSSVRIGLNFAPKR